ncbi:hypothetical protein QBC39DRAFT_339649 [Podospora conica]|nr:hypothetical protein QBC39DRAFT_339649 [Schizothecium conicum]
MSAPRCLFNSAAALRRVFFSNALPSEATSSLRRPLLLLSHQPRRTAVWSKKRGRNTAEEDENRVKTDLNIRSPMIYLRDEETGKLGDPQDTREVLRSLNLKTEMLVMVAESVDMAGGAWPVCRVVDRQAAEEKERAKAREARQQSVMEKELEINWKIAGHDLDYKMRQLRTFLGKGFKVTVTLQKSRKVRGRKEATQEQVENTMECVEGVIAEVPGTKEIKEREGTVGETVIIVLQGQKVKAEKGEKVAKDEKERVSEPVVEEGEAKVAGEGEAEVAGEGEAKVADAQ